MCHPAVSAAIAFVSTAVGTVVQSSQASKQQNYQNAIAKRNADLANRAAITQYKALNDQAVQEAIKAGQAITDIARDSELARSRVEAAAVNAGVAGSSVEALLRDFEKQEGDFITATLLNEDFALEQIDLEKESVHTGHEGRLIASTPPLIQGPNLLGAAATALSGSYNAYISAGGTFGEDDE